MSELKHTVEKTPVGGIHRETPGKRSHEDFDVNSISITTAQAFERVCVSGSASPEDYRHVFESVLGSAVVAAIVKKGGAL